MRIDVICPEGPIATRGNRASALRIARLLRERHDVRVAAKLGKRPGDACIALHAGRSADAIVDYAARAPHGRLVVLLTGTDVYGDRAFTADVMRSLRLAWRIVSAQPLAFARIDPDLRDKARAIPKSATVPNAAADAARNATPSECLEVVALSHLRAEKDPLLLARAMDDAPDHRRVLIQLLREEGDAQRLRAALTAAAERWPDDADVRHALALVCLDQHDLGCASAEIEHLDTSGRTLRASILKARKALIRKDNSAARAELAASRALGARDRDFLLASADIHRRLGDLPAAREDLDRAWPLVALDPPFAAHTLAARGRLELELGDPRHAVTAYEQAYAQVAKPVFAASALAAAKKANAPHLADALLKRARGEFPNAPVLAPAAAPPPLHD